MSAGDLGMPLLAAAGLDWMRAESWPFVALAVLLLVPLVWLGARARRERSSRHGAVVADAVPAAAGQAGLAAAIATLLGLAWLGPRYGEERVEIERRGLDLVFCLDVSRSMLARDADARGELTRLQRAKRDVRAALEVLSGGDRVALVAFAGEARLVVPLTHDVESFAGLIELADPDSVRTGGSDLGAAIEEALGLLEAGGESSSAIVLLTDGEDLAGRGRRAGATAAARGVAVHAVGYGSTRGAKILLDEGGEQRFLTGEDGEEVISSLDVEGLTAVAEATGGEFLRADVVPLPIVELHAERLAPMVERAYESAQETIGRPRFQWVLLPAIILMLVEMFWIGGRRR